MVNAQADNGKHSIQADKKDIAGEYVRKRFIALMKKPFDDSDKTKILIIGDSHAQDFLNAIAENNYLNNSQIRSRYIPTRCQIFLGDAAKRDWLETDQQLCEKSDSLTLATAQIANAEVIILAALWRKWTAIELPDTIKKLNLADNQQLFVIGRRSFVGSHQDSNAKRSEVDVHQLEINQIMNENFSKSTDKVTFIDVHKLVCGTGSSCPIFTDTGQLISVDGGHLSRDGARYIGQILFQKSQLSNMLK